MSVCYKCDRDADRWIPIEPRGKKNRKWICELCLKELPVWKQKILYRNGKRRTLRLFLINMYYKYFDRT